MRNDDVLEPNDGIELLYTRDCQAWPQTLANLKTALRKLGIKEEPRVIPIDTLDQATAYQFFASPTIHIHGVDVDPKARRINRRSLGSGRPYFYKGQATGAPPTGLIVEGLQELYLA